jgi:hypothetical protein
MKGNIVTATITASGKMWHPFTIFKGALNGRITTCKFANYPPGRKYACAFQQKAWMDKVQMHTWIKICSKPYKNEKDASNPGGQPPILILDEYLIIDEMGSVENLIQVMGIEHIHIPTSCTNYVSPLIWELTMH